LKKVRVLVGLNDGRFEEGDMDVDATHELVQFWIDSNGKPDLLIVYDLAQDDTGKHTFIKTCDIRSISYTTS